MYRRASSSSHLKTLASWRSLPRPNPSPNPNPIQILRNRVIASNTRLLTESGTSLLKKTVEDVMPIATGLEREEIAAKIEGRKRFDMDPPVGRFGTRSWWDDKGACDPFFIKSPKIIPMVQSDIHFQGGQLSRLRVSVLSSKRIPRPFYQYIQYSGFFSSLSLSAEDVSNMEPISSPLTPLLGDGKTKAKDGTSKPLTVQAIKKGIKQSPKKVNLVAKLVRGMRVEDALLQLQVTVKRAAKTVYQVIHSARANAAHNHGLDPDRLLVAEAFVGKGLYLKRLSYHAKGRSGIMVRPRCRLTVVVRETTPEEEAKIAKLRVSNYKKLTRQERQLVPHQLIETMPRWGRKIKEAVASSA